MASEDYLSNLKSIRATLRSYGVENDELNRAIEDAEKYPSGKVVDQYNELVEVYNNASGTNQWISSANELIDYYESNQEQLQDPSRDKAFADLKQAIEDTQRIARLIDEAEALWEEQ